MEFELGLARGFAEAGANRILDGLANSAAIEANQTEMEALGGTVVYEGADLAKLAEIIRTPRALHRRDQHRDERLRPLVPDPIRGLPKYDQRFARGVVVELADKPVF